MTKLFFTIPLVFISLYGASFNCNKVNTNIEKAICNNSNLSDIDSRLSKKYTQIKKELSFDESKTLLDSQRKWLKEQKNCETSKHIDQCLNLLYEERMTFLEQNYKKTLLKTTPSHDEIKTICNDLAKNPVAYIQKHRINDNIDFDINNDGKKERVSIEMFGNRELHMMNATYTKPNGEEVSTSNKDDQSYGNLFLQIGSMVYQVYLWNPIIYNNYTKPLHLTYINSLNEEVDVCDFTNKTVETIVPNLKNQFSSEICPLVDTMIEITGDENFKFSNYPSTIGKGRLPRIKVKEVKISLNNAYFKQVYNNQWHSEDTTAALYDFDNDGIKDKLITINHVESERQLCSVSHLDVVVDGKKPKTDSRDLLLRIQGLDLDDDYPTCSSLSGFFAYKGQIYYEDFRDEKHNILQIKDHKISTICTGKFETTTTVKAIMQ